MTVDEIDPETWYYVDYEVYNEGNRIYKPTALQGKYLTENQILTAKLITI